MSVLHSCVAMSCLPHSSRLLTGSQFSSSLLLQASLYSPADLLPAMDFGCSWGEGDESERAVNEGIQNMPCVQGLVVSSRGYWHHCHQCRAPVREADRQLTD